MPRPVSRSFCRSRSCLSRRLVCAAPVALLALWVLAVPAGAAPLVLARDSSGGGRGVSLAALLLALAGVVAGVRALRAAGRGGGGFGGRGAAVAAVGLGVAGAAVGGVVLAGSDAAVGAGGGRGGALIAVALGGAGVCAGAVAWFRSRRGA